MTSSYDDIAGLYELLWSDWYLPAAMPALEKLFFTSLSAGSRVLDVCCGSGHVTRELVRRGYRVTGVDKSAALIDIARRKLPGVDFRVQDVEQLHMDGPFDGAISTFDSLNHVLSLDGLGRVFKGVHNCLLPGGRFVFDMNMPEAYSLDLSDWQVTVTEDLTGLVRGRFDPLENKAETELIWFARQGESESWTRRKSVVEQRCYELAEVAEAMAKAGFEPVETVPAYQAGMGADLAMGRMFFVAIG